MLVVQFHGSTFSTAVGKGIRCAPREHTYMIERAREKTISTSGSILHWRMQLTGGSKPNGRRLSNSGST